MAIKPIKGKVGEGDFELTPAGVYLARCYRMVDIGTQTVESKQFGTKVHRQVILTWELLEDETNAPVLMADGRPFAINKTYKLSMHSKANLRKDIDAWRGLPFTDAEAADFDITKLLEKFCVIQVVHSTSGDKTYANIGSIMSTKKTAQGVNPVVGFSVEDPDMVDFQGLPEWIQKKIVEAPEWGGVEASIDVVEDQESEGVDISGVPF